MLLILLHSAVRLAALRASEMMSLQMTILFQMANEWFDGAAPFELTLDGGRRNAARVGDDDVQAHPLLFGHHNKTQARF